MRIGLYCRVSTGEQNVEMQLNELREFCKSRGWEIVREYCDQGYSGTNADRPMLKALMTDVRARKVDAVLCWKLDRLFRSLKHTVLTLNEFADLGVTFVSLRDQIDMSTAAGRLMMHMISSFSEFEAALIKERVRAGLANRKAKGLRLGRTPQIDRIKVLKLRKQGMSLSQIAKAVGSTKSGVSKTLRKAALQGPEISATKNTA